ncbi:translation factor GTPase family protein [Sporosarcina aquimarina]|uniref:TetM/TetW/TetO/TetS family tetracycline resistance ribosomal protection protein n=1 Tax=Sporosarcina aquimarina TaxID=114975 RepID=A0ABU4G3L3_9BACL|nr:translation factor GTPase family protein [Sporosarcina aquimarina]MDW0110242.1 TetM/TetW/TetO/TetS family tetracycline resistance ribosomal protection protein [Sporosarcina aquimarina]
MKQTIGILAHVDAGKTTFSEQLLYLTKQIRERGRVDHQDAFLDNHSIERARGITVFAEQAEIEYDGHAFTLIDTPGHADFSPEMERAVHVMDAAILLVSAADGVQGHTERVWQLLRGANVPTFLFINKMDRYTANANTILTELQESLSSDCFDLRHIHSDGTMSEEFVEWLAERDETLLTHYLEDGFDSAMWLDTLKKLIMDGRVFPCGNGSALKDIGIESFFSTFVRLTNRPFQDSSLAPFSGSVYKIRHDENGQRLTFLKVHSGVLRARDEVVVGSLSEKITQIRVYSGTRFTQISEAAAGDLVAVTGLTNAATGDSIGVQGECAEFSSVPALKVAVQFDPSHSSKDVWNIFRLLDAEDPTLHAAWNEHSQEIEIRVMGVIQLEVLQHIVHERFNMSVTFGTPTILYKETIAAPVYGYGHFEPLKHYAEVHVKLEPAERETGIQFHSVCHTDALSYGHQRVIEKHLFEREHHGLLTGSPLTDLSVTLLTGRSHNEHTSGGDFRESLFRAIRQGLEQAENLLLEPYYAFKMKVDSELIGRVLTDIQQAHGTFNVPETSGPHTIVTGSVPVATFINYNTEFASYTGGKGVLLLTFDGYGPCHNTEEVIERIGYDKSADPEYSSSSVFCTKGKGYTVPWQEAKAAMHCEVIE